MVPNSRSEKQEEYISSHFNSFFIQTEQNRINCQTWETSQDQKRFENDSSSQPSIVIDELSPKRGEGTRGRGNRNKKQFPRPFFSSTVTFSALKVASASTKVAPFPGIQTIFLGDSRGTVSPKLFGEFRARKSSAFKKYREEKLSLFFFLFLFMLKFKNSFSIARGPDSENIFL